MKITWAVLLSTATLLLAIFGGGAFWTATWFTAVGLCSSWLIMRILDVRHRRRAIFSRTEMAFAALLAFILLTVLPMPRPFDALAGRIRFSENERAYTALQRAEQLGLVNAPPHTFAASRNRAGTLRGLVLLCLAASGFMLSARLDPHQARIWLRFLCLLGTAIGGAGIVSLARLPQGDTLWWHFDIPHGLPGPVACFVNRNHLSAFMAMLLPIPCALLMRDFQKRFWTAVCADAAAIAVVVTGSALTLSRGGMLAMASAVLAFVLLQLADRRRLTAVLSLLLLCVLIATVVMAVAPGLLHRFSAFQAPGIEDSIQTRRHAWIGCLRIWHRYPVLGAGVNAFRMVYPQVRTTSQSGFMTHAENEYLQALGEIGVTGVILTAILFLALRRLFKRPVRSDYPVTRLACIPALCAVGVSATMEFALHVPLVALAAATLLGILAARHQPPADGDDDPAHRHRALCAVFPAAFALLAVLLVGPHCRSMQRMDAPEFLSTANAPQLAHALTWSPTSWSAWYHLGREACLAGHQPGVEFGRRCLRQAVDYDPLNYNLWLQWGKLELSCGNRQNAEEAFRRVKELRWWVPVPAVNGDTP